MSSSNLSGNPYRQEVATESQAAEIHPHLSPENLDHFHYELPTDPIETPTASKGFCSQCIRYAMLISEFREVAKKLSEDLERLRAALLHHP